VVELFPRRALVPRTLPDVLDCVFQLQYTSRLALDAEFFDRISHIVDLAARIDAAMPPDSDIRDDPTYRQIRPTAGSSTSTSSPRACRASATDDFSRASCETRIRAGYDDAVAQGIGNPRAPGLRRGATAAREDAAPRR
jgi:NTE family protein